MTLTQCIRVMTLFCLVVSSVVDVSFVCQLLLKFARWQHARSVGCVVSNTMETTCRIVIWQTFGRIQWHVIPEPYIILQGAAIWRIQCHDSKATWHIARCSHLTNQSHDCATWHIAECKNSIGILKIVFRHILFFFVFNAVQLLTSGGFCIISNTLVYFRDSFTSLSLKLNK